MKIQYLLTRASGSYAAGTKFGRMHVPLRENNLRIRHASTILRAMRNETEMIHQLLALFMY